MKTYIIVLTFVLYYPMTIFAQFGAEYASYGFNFVNDTYNDGWNGWQSDNLGNTAKLDIYKNSTTLNDYVLEIKAQNDTTKLLYDDSGHMDLNTCSFVINLRLKIPQFTGNQDEFSFQLNTGSKLIAFQFKNTGIYYIDGSQNVTYITAAPATNTWKTYTISLDGCSAIGNLMIENDDVNSFALTFPDETQSPSIELYTFTNGGSVFEAEIDHLFIYSNPTKWWLSSSVPYGGESNYIGTTGDRQHYLNLPNGERVGVNENGGGYMTYTQLYAGGDNLYPNPKFGSGGTKTLRNYFHSADNNPVQAGTSSTTGGHLATITVSANELAIEPFPLHLYYKSGVTEHNPLTFPDGNVMTDFDNSTDDDDVYDEFGLDMRHEIITELDFSSKLQDVSASGGISVIRHTGEWEYIRHSCQVLQYHEPTASQRFSLNGTPHSDADMGLMRHKFEFRMNKDLGYEWVLWRNNGQWDSLHLVTTGQSQNFVSNNYDVANLAVEDRFMIFSTSSSLNDTNAIAWYYPESVYNANCTVEKSRTDKSVVSQTDRRLRMEIRSDWRKTNWCRMNLYIFNEGLLAPQNGNPNTYETFQMEAYQLFGTPTQIWNTIQTITLPVELTTFEVTATAHHQVQINWQTATETNNDFFTIERSKDGSTWENIATIKGAGTAVEATNYDFIDKNPFSDISFYRIKQTDFDGRSSYSDIKSVLIDHKNHQKVTLFPNPTTNLINGEVSDFKILSIKIIDNIGREVTHQTSINLPSNRQFTADLTNLPKGIYYIILNDEVIKSILKVDK